MRQQTLGEYTACYLLERGVSRSYAQMVRATVVSFSTWLQRPARLSDLTPDQVNRWLSDIAETMPNRWTLRGRRGRLLAIWRDAFDRGVVSVPALRIRRIPRPAAMPVAGDPVDVSRLIALADSLDGCYRRTRTPKRLFWRAYWLVSYYGGFRTYEPFSLRFDSIYQPVFWFSQDKTRLPKLVSLDTVAIAAVRELHEARPTCEYVFRGAISRRYFYEEYRRLRSLAGVPGAGRWLRRTAGTQTEIDHPGQGHLLLGNSRQVFERHYNDRTKHGRPPRPPKIA